MSEPGHDLLADAAFLEVVGIQLDAVGAALERFGDAEAARCEECGVPFDVEELLADPHRSYCAWHAPCSDTWPGPNPGEGPS
jgi:hypothetical protein